MRNPFQRGLSAAAASILALTLVLPAAAADPLASGGFAQVLISAQETDFPKENLSLTLYQRNQSQVFQTVETLSYVTAMNRVSKDVVFHMTPSAQQVTVTVDYLTDLDGNGSYELVSGQENPVGDVLSPSETLVPISSGVSSALTVGKTYAISAQQLLEGGERAIQNRTTPGSTSYLAGMSGQTQSADQLVYMVTVSYHSTSDNKDYELCYYLRLYDEIPAPCAADYLDVPAGAWYYNAVDYVVSQGLLSGTARSTFAPNQSVSRAMLAQVLYQVAGQPESGVSNFSDVSTDHWSYSSVSWAVRVGIMSGSADGHFYPDRALTRQELALSLYQFAEEMGVNTKPRSGLGIYADANDVAYWAKDAMSWSVAMGLLSGRTSGSSQVLAPQETVSRAEFAAVLSTLCQKVLA